MAQIATLSHVAQDKEPSCQKISWASSTSDAPHCMNASRALKVNSIAIPTRIIAMCETPRSLENMEKERSTQGKDKCFHGHKQTACTRNCGPTKNSGQCRTKAGRRGKTKGEGVCQWVVQDRLHFSARVSKYGAYERRHQCYRKALLPDNHLFFWARV